MFGDIKYTHNLSSKYQASVSSGVQSYRTRPTLLMTVVIMLVCVYYSTVLYTHNHICRAYE